MEALLAPSLAAARNPESAQPGQEKIFHIAGHVFLGTKYGAADQELVEALAIGGVVNLTAGRSRVPNHLEAHGVQYVHLELMDELISDPTHAVAHGLEAIRWWGQEGTNVLVHCQAGLSRSVTLVLAWLVRDMDHSLQSATELLIEQRGRRPKVNPSFWCFLAKLERELRGWKAGTQPSFDFTPWLQEDMKAMGLRYSADKIAKALHDDADWVDLPLFYFALCGWGLDRMVQAQCIAQRPKVGLAAGQKAADIALEFVEVYRAWPAVQAFALRILQSLVSNGDPRLSAALVTMGTIGKALGAMFANPGDADVQEAGCGTLAYLAAASASNISEISLLGGVPAVLEAMRRHVPSEQLQATGCATLLALSSSPQAMALIVCMGGVQATLSAMWGHPDAAKVQELGCAVLASLALHPTAKASIASLGGCETIRRAVMEHPAELKLQQRASQAMRMLALQPVSFLKDARSPSFGWAAPTYSMESPGAAAAWKPSQTYSGGYPAEAATPANTAVPSWGLPGA